MTTTKKLSTLALAAAAFTTLAAGGSASAKLVHSLPIGHGPIVVAGTAGTKPLPYKIAPGIPVSGGPVNGAPAFPPHEGGHGPVIPPHDGSNGGGHLVTCQIGKGCTVTPPVSGDRDHDHDHDGHDRDGWRDRPEIVIEGAPAAVPVQVAPALMQVAPAPVQSVPARVSVPAAQVVQGPCNCLTKQTLADGSVLFQDICTKQSAIVPPQAVGAR